MNSSLIRRLVAEFVGTAVLVLFGAGSVVAAMYLGNGTLGYAGLGIISLAFGLAVALAVYTVGTTSGAHINPAVTLALAVVQRFKWAEVAPYIVAQLAGAVAGALLVVAYVGSRATTLGSVGLTSLGTDVTVVQGALAEGLGTFLLLFVIMAVAVDPRTPAGWAGLIGLAVEIMAIGPFTGGSRQSCPHLRALPGEPDLRRVDALVGVLGLHRRAVRRGALAAACYELLARPADAPPIGADVEGGMPEAEPQKEPPAIPGQPRREALARRHRGQT